MISATLCAIICSAPVVQVLPLERRLDRSSVLETGLTRARHEPAIGATTATRLVGLRRSLARVLSTLCCCGRHLFERRLLAAAGARAFVCASPGLTSLGYRRHCFRNLCVACSRALDQPLAGGPATCN